MKNRLANHFASPAANAARCRHEICSAKTLLQVARTLQCRKAHHINTQMRGLKSRPRIAVSESRAAMAAARHYCRGL